MFKPKSYRLLNPIQNEQDQLTELVFLFDDLIVRDITKLVVKHNAVKSLDFIVDIAVLCTRCTKAQIENLKLIDFTIVVSLVSYFLKNLGLDNDINCLRKTSSYLGSFYHTNPLSFEIMELADFVSLFETTVNNAQEQAERYKSY